MILIADSGLTKTNWRIVLSDKTIVPFNTKGLNPFFCNDEDYYNALQSAFPSKLNPLMVSKVYFYGSGCAGEEKPYKVKQSLQSFFRKAEVYAYSDLFAVARSLFGDNKGVVAILGTGSNVAYYDGLKIIHRTPSLGFILGDEGSGAYIGRLMLKAYFYGQLPDEVSASFKNRFDLELSHVLSSIYSQPKPSNYIASFVPFVKENIENEYLNQLVYMALNEFYEVHLQVMPELKEYGLGVVGSVGFVFKDILNRIAKEKRFEIKGVIQYPIDSLVSYHIRKEF